MNKSLKTEIIILAGLIISFFLPWLDFGIMSISGYEIPNRISNIVSLANTISDSDGTPPILIWSYIIYLIPLLSILAIVFNFNGRHKKFLGLGAGIFALVLLVFCYLKFGKEFENVFSFFGIGIYGTLLFSIALITTSIFNKKRSNDKPNENNKADLLNQLEKIHELKEKGVLTAGIYESERTSILEKLEETNTIDSEVKNINITELLQSLKKWFKDIFILLRNKKIFIYSTSVLLLVAIIWISISIFNKMNNKTTYSSNSSIFLYPKQASYEEIEGTEYGKLSITLDDTDFYIEYDELNWGESLSESIQLTSDTYITGASLFKTKNILYLFTDEAMGGDRYGYVYKIDLEKKEIVWKTYMSSCALGNPKIRIINNFAYTTNEKILEKVDLGSGEIVYGYDFYNDESSHFSSFDTITFNKNLTYFISGKDTVIVNEKSKSITVKKQ